jgi:uncharacterized membrane protein YbhN (UPF0104 family)
VSDVPSRADFVRYVVLVFKLFVIPVGLLILATEVVKDPRLGLVTMDVTMLAGALAVNQIALTLFAARMQLVLRAFGVALTIVQSLRVHLQSMFYFFVLPMTVGLEVARFTKIRTMVGERANAGALTYALVADRLMGAVAALILAVALLPFVEFKGLIRWGSGSPWLLWGVAGVGAALVISMHGKVREHLREVWALCRSGRHGLLASLAVALLTHGCFAFGIHLAAAGANVQITFLQTLFVICAAMLFVVFPVSFAGVSPVEAAGLGVLVGMGIPVDQAAIFVLLSYLAKLVAAFEGGGWEVYEGGGHVSRMLFAKDRLKP